MGIGSINVNHVSSSGFSRGANQVTTAGTQLQVLQAQMDVLRDDAVAQQIQSMTQALFSRPQQVSGVDARQLSVAVNGGLSTLVETLHGMYEASDSEFLKEIVSELEAMKEKKDKGLDVMAELAIKLKGKHTSMTVHGASGSDLPKEVLESILNALLESGGGIEDLEELALIMAIVGMLGGFLPTEIAMKLDEALDDFVDKMVASHPDPIARGAILSAIKGLVSEGPSPITVPKLEEALEKVRMEQNAKADVEGMELDYQDAVLSVESKPAAASSAVAMQHQLNINPTGAQQAAAVKKETVLNASSQQTGSTRQDGQYSDQRVEATADAGDPALATDLKNAPVLDLLVTQMEREWASVASGMVDVFTRIVEARVADKMDDMTTMADDVLRNL